MARQMPVDLADEIRATRGPWRQSGARFRPPGDCGTGISIWLGEGELRSEIALDKRPPRARSHEAVALERTGYELLKSRSRPFHAWRPLRSMRELDAEVKRLTALSLDLRVMASFPHRASRRLPRSTTVRPFSIFAFDRLRHAHGWTAEFVSVGRRGEGRVIEAPGYSTGAWCLFVDDGPDRWIDLHVQLYRKPSSKSGAAEFAKAQRAIRNRLAPLGYRAVALRGEKVPPLWAIFEKRVSAPSDARRERSRLDRVLFGD
jgi:hypothetical protein